MFYNVTYANVETSTFSRSVQADTPLGVIAVGATKHNADPWPPATVILPPGVPFTSAHWDVIAHLVEGLFNEYRKRYEGVIEAPAKRLARSRRGPMPPDVESFGVDVPGLTDSSSADSSTSAGSSADSSKDSSSTDSISSPSKNRDNKS